MDRRTFLKLAGFAGIGIATPLGLGVARAQEEGEFHDGPYYLVFNASGGWDTSYIMDPKGVNGINRLYGDGDILTSREITYAPNQANITAGMSNEAFFGKYGDDLLVVNGIDYSVNNHAPCSRYAATGKLDSLAYPTFAALVAACKGSEQPLSFLTFGNYSATGNLVAQSRIPYMNRLKALATVDRTSMEPYHSDFASSRLDETLANQRLERAARPQLPRVERAQSMLFTGQLSASKLARVEQYIPATATDGRLERQADIALACFKAGISVSANLTIGQFDSHNDNDADQMRLIPEFLAGVDYAVEKAAELGILDRLVIVLQSEMGRTPHYNNGNGKDHWSIGSMMFMGAGIRGGRVVGATDEGQMPFSIVPDTLALDDAGIRIRPEHIHAALRDLAGIGDHPFAEQFPLDVPDGEAIAKIWQG